MFLNSPTTEQQICIRQATNEDPNTTNRDVAIIKEWLKKQPHLPDTWEDQIIINFLRGCNFSLEQCKKKLDMLFTMRSLVPEFFVDRNVANAEIQEIIKLAQFTVLPDMTPDGKRVCVGKAIRTDFHTPDVIHVIKLVLMMGEIRLREEKFGSAGDIYVVDASIALSHHFFKTSLTNVKKFIVCVEEAYPVKVKEVHFINATPFLDFLINVVKPFCKEKIRNRIHVHSDLESLYKFVPKNILPEEFGGTAGKLEVFKAQWIKKMEEYTPWFKEQENIRSDESKRLGKPTNHDELFGVDGSFKQLSID